MVRRGPGHSSGDQVAEQQTAFLRLQRLRLRGCAAVCKGATLFRQTSRTAQ